MKKTYLKLDTPIQYVKGIGPQLAQVFKKKDIGTVKDLIHYFPRAYQDNRHIKSFSEIIPQRSVVIVAQIVNKKIIPVRGRKKNFYEVTISDGSQFICCKFFRTLYKGWFQSLELGQTVEVRGSASFYKNKLEFHHPQIFPFREEEGFKEENVLLPVYSEIGNISQHKIRKVIQEALESLEESLEWLPEWLMKKYQLLDQLTALKGIHQPDFQLVEDYVNFKTPFQKRLIFDEFFELQMYLALKRRGWKEQVSSKIPIDTSLINEVEGQLPFSLTEAQKKVLLEIFSDLNSSNPMHRLVQGDVGCGKTVVALITGLGVAKKGFQTALMAPTEILAEQHFKNAQKLLEPFGVKVEKLTGKMKAGEKKNVSGALKSGFCHVCVGTHALIQKEIQFRNLGLVIVDEQHRFGAHQRAELKSKGNDPHFLVMTATPIPRTLSMTLYGDLEVSVIDEMPAGRLPVVTKKTFFKKRNRVFDFLKQQIEEGRQGYVVYPLIEESEVLDLKNVIEQYDILKEMYPSIRWGVLTGRMSSEEKQEIMGKFRKNEIQVLVTTTVIEVGVDVPNASVMVIEHGERFGLSQMHQLRGRIGRGSYKSYCIIVLGENFSKMALERAGIMESTPDGFKIAEKDLELRGPGEFLGSRQSGLPGFKMAHLIRDVGVLSLAQKACFDLISKDAQLLDSSHSHVKRKFQELLVSISPG